jgi:DNA-binding CsgD family transcriptional regulator
MWREVWATTGRCGDIDVFYYFALDISIDANYCSDINWSGSMAGERAAGFDELLVQLRMTNALLAAMLQRQHDLSQRDVVALLASTGAAPAEIAAAVGTTVNTVRVTLSRAGIRKPGP